MSIPANHPALLDKAIFTATMAHSGQLDKAGMPYIMHPMRCMQKVWESTKDYELAAAMVLHDVIEDTHVTAQNLLDMGMTPRVVALVKTLSRKDGESYGQFIDRCSESYAAAKLKLEDLNDNRNLDRLPQITEKDLDRYEKYTIAALKLDRVVRSFELNIVE